MSPPVRWFAALITRPIFIRWCADNRQERAHYTERVVFIVIPSEVENGAAGDSRDMTGRPEVEPTEVSESNLWT